MGYSSLIYETHLPVNEAFLLFHLESPIFEAHSNKNCQEAFGKVLDLSQEHLVVLYIFNFPKKNKRLYDIFVVKVRANI